MGEIKTFALTDHACRECGGRILRQTNAGFTCGGNPIFVCADCERSACNMGPDDLCWCGFCQRGSYEQVYCCVHRREIEKNPWLERALIQSGFSSSSKLQVGAVNRELAKRCEQEYWDAKINN